MVMWYRVVCPKIINMKFIAQNMLDTKYSQSKIIYGNLLPYYGFQTSILCKESGLSLSSDSVSLLCKLGERNVVAAIIHNPLPVQRSTYISVKLPDGLCTQV